MVKPDVCVFGLAIDRLGVRPDQAWPISDAAPDAAPDDQDAEARVTPRFRQQASQDERMTHQLWRKVSDPRRGINAHGVRLRACAFSTAGLDPRPAVLHSQGRRAVRLGAHVLRAREVPPQGACAAERNMLVPPHAPMILKRPDFRGGGTESVRSRTTTSRLPDRQRNSIPSRASSRSRWGGPRLDPCVRPDRGPSDRSIGPR